MTEERAVHDPRAMRDPLAIRALSHPLRLRLIELLGTRQQATATDCAAVTGESVASCSFHLRQLERYGFAERAEASGRERPWRLTSTTQNLDTANLDDEGRLASQAFEQAFLEWEVARLRARGTRPTPPGWEGTQNTSGATMWLTRDELVGLNRAMGELLTRHLGRVDGTEPRPSDGRWVRLFAASTVLTDLDPAEPDAARGPES